jgi:hypothetical protein
MVLGLGNTGVFPFLPDFSDFFFGGTSVWTQASCLLGRQSTIWIILPALFCGGCFWERILWAVCQGWLWTPDLCLLSSKDYKCEPLVPGSDFYFIYLSIFCDIPGLAQVSSGDIRKGLHGFGTCKLFGNCYTIEPNWYSVLSYPSRMALDPYGLWSLFI